MRHLLILATCLVTTLTFSQTLTDKYLHFRTDDYWDTTLYKSEKDFYYELNKGTIIQKTYPVLHYLFSTIINDTPFFKNDSFERRDHIGHPYKYIRKSNYIYLRYVDLRKHRLRLNKEYSLNPADTVKWLVNKSSLDSKAGGVVGGISTYLGEELIELNDKQFKTFKFLEDHDERGSHSNYYTNEVFLDQATLIPIKFITRYYDYKTRQRKLYYSVTLLFSSGNTLPDFTNKRAEDLIVYENKNTKWTDKQKQEFLKMFEPGLKSYADCLLEKLDGKISFFQFQQNRYFRQLFDGKECR
jgi:hypothetical protein